MCVDKKIKSLYLLNQDEIEQILHKYEITNNQNNDETEQILYEYEFTDNQNNDDIKQAYQKYKIENATKELKRKPNVIIPFFIISLLILVGVVIIFIMSKSDIDNQIISNNANTQNKLNENSTEIKTTEFETIQQEETNDYMNIVNITTLEEANAFNDDGNKKMGQKAKFYNVSIYYSHYLEQYSILLPNASYGFMLVANNGIELSDYEGKNIDCTIVVKENTEKYGGEYAGDDYWELVSIDFVYE